MLPSPDIGVIGVPDGGAKPGGGIGCPGFDGAIPPSFQDAGISPVWGRQELTEVGPLQAS